jgi:hypothetical protein
MWNLTKSWETNERKNLALLIMLVWAIIFTIYAIVGLWLVSSTAVYIFWLAIAAHGQVFMLLAGFTAQLVKRRISLGRDGVHIDDRTLCKEENH